MTFSYNWELKQLGVSCIYAINAHIFNETHFDRCSKCGLTKEMCEDGYSCGKVQCAECTLIRVCVGDPPRCQECYERIQKG